MDAVFVSRTLTIAPFAIPHHPGIRTPSRFGSQARPALTAIDYQPPAPCHRGPVLICMHAKQFVTASSTLHAGLLGVALQSQGRMMFRLSRPMLSCLAALCLLWPLASAHAQQAYQRLIPLLIDFDGWQGKKPDGMSMETSDMKMTTASRDYERVDARLQTGVVVGQAAVAAMAPIEAGMNIQTPQGHMMSSSMRGMKMIRQYSIEDKSGMLMVALDQDALFTLTYNGIGEDEALKLLDKYDWKALQAAAQKK
jgi:hypothetical protein